VGCTDPMKYPVWDESELIHLVLETNVQQPLCSASICWFQATFFTYSEKCIRSEFLDSGAHCASIERVLNRERMFRK
jgi:hypothetical protein